jgi:predicted nuclease of predicted toxin-antitoxin system
MRFLADENVPRPSVERLRRAGIDIASVSEDCPGVSDDAVLAFARKNRQIIMTFDSDYGELVFRRLLPTPPGLLYLHFIPRTPEELVDYALRLLRHPELRLEGLFTTVSRNRIRQRPLPPSSNP